MPNHHELLTDILAEFKEFLSDYVRQGIYAEHDDTACYVVAYLDAYHSFMENNPDYPLDDVFYMLIEVMSNPINIDVIAEGLLLKFIQISDLRCNHGTASENFQEVIDAIKALPKRLFNYISVSSDSTTAQYINANSDVQIELVHTEPNPASTKGILDSFLGKLTERSHLTDSQYFRSFFISAINSSELSLTLKAIGEIATQGVQPSESVILRKLPISTQIVTTEMDATLIKELEEFIEHFIKINNQADPHHRANLTLFFLKYESKIMLLIQYMGEDAFRFMRSYLTGTTLPLQRMLEQLPNLEHDFIILLGNYYNQLKLTNKVKHEEMIFFKDCLILIDIISHTENNNKPIITNKLTENPRPAQLHQELIKFISSIINPESTKKTDETALDDLIKKLEPTRISQLIAASEIMENDEYRDIYLKLLKFDLFGNNIDVDNFLHNTEQEDTLGADLAKHNKQIQTLLENHNIPSKKALDYQEKFDFIVRLTDAKDTSEKNAIFTLWTYIIKLKQIIIEEKLSHKNITALLNNIEKIENSIKKNHKDKKTNSSSIVPTLQLKSNKDLIKKITSNLETIHGTNVTTSQRFAEFSRHIRDQALHLASLEPNSTQKTVNANYPIRFVQWKKDDNMTFFFGRRCWMLPCHN